MTSDQTFQAIQFPMLSKHGIRMLWRQAMFESDPVRVSILDFFDLQLLFS